MSILRFLANRVTAADLQSPLGPTLSLSDSVADAEAAALEPLPMPRDWSRLGDDPADRICLVTGPDGHVTHALWGLTIMEADRTVAEVAEPILPEDCVAGDTPALQLVGFFSSRSRRWALVMNDTRLTGYVSWTDFSKPEFSVCIFALLLEVEQQCAEALANDADIERIWASLTPSRQAKATQIYADRFHRSPSIATPPALVFCTTFIDKVAMLSALPAFADVPKRQLHADFVVMEKLRNVLAHTGTGVVMGLEDLTAAIEAAETTLKRVTPKEEPAIRLVKRRT